MRKLFVEEELLPELKVETKLAYDRLVLEVVYRQLADAQMATKELLELS